MESTFISLVISNYALGIIYLIMNLMFLAGAAILAFKKRKKSLTAVTIGWFLLSFNMLFVWITPSVNPVVDAWPLYVASMLGLILFFVGGIFYTIGSFQRIRHERDMHKGKVEGTAKIVDRRAS